MKRIAAAVFFLFVSSAAAAPGEPYSDEWIRGRISGAFAYNAALDSSNLAVASNGGNVTLSGRVPTLVERDFAEAIARAADGVKSVQNEIQVDESLALKSRSSFGQKLHDAAITAAVKSKLFANRNTQAASINVDTEANAVTLRGSVDTEKTRAAAQQIAANTSGVRSVHNELLVRPSNERARLEEPASPGGIEAAPEKSKDLTTALSDVWISTKIRSMLAFDANYPGSDIAVTTTNGTAKLEGYVQTNTQKLSVAEAVRDVNGVKSVDNQLTVLHNN